MTQAVKYTSTEVKREAQIVNSALWAAAGDALGWITELGDEQTVRHRIGTPLVTQTAEWRRRIGGKFGPTVKLPAGAISDDTQLRLAVSRSIRADGHFDVETFAKVELPVWMSYSLGAGKGTTAAAGNLARSSVAWFSNFFGKSGERGYFEAGGNGAAMRIQPHVWKRAGSRNRKHLLDVFKDAIVTHGAPRGFMGAVFHALCLEYALTQNRAPGPTQWLDFASSFSDIADIVSTDEQLSLFWLPSWEASKGQRLRVAISDEANLVVRAAHNASGLMLRDYKHFVSELGGFEESQRGAGLNTALSAAFLSFAGQDQSIEETLILAANTLGSDTDTIASMAGAILGATSSETVPWPIQDEEYVIAEAKRLAKISTGGQVAAVPYPNLMAWSPPSNQIDAVGSFQGEIYLAGLGRLSAFGEHYKTSEAEWQWYRLPWGQTILAKQRANVRKLAPADLPDLRATGSPIHSDDDMPLFHGEVRPIRDSAVVPRSPSRKQTVEPRQFAALQREQSDDLSLNIDELTQRLISRGFPPADVGAAIVHIANGPNGVERSIAFSAILAKAIQTRKRRPS